MTADAGTTGGITFNGIASGLADVTANGTFVILNAKLSATGAVTVNTETFFARARSAVV